MILCKYNLFKKHPGPFMPKQANNKEHIIIIIISVLKSSIRKDDKQRNLPAAAGAMLLDQGSRWNCGSEPLL